MIFSKYIKSRIRVIIFFVFMLLIFAFITMLAGIPWNVSLYAGLLQLFFALIIGSIDYFRFMRYINILKDCENNLMYTARTDLPPRDLIDEEYQRLYAEVHDMLIEAIKERESLESGLNDYYKTWVHQIKTPLSALYLIVQNSSIEEKNEIWMQLARIDGYLDMLLKFIKLASDNTDFVLMLNQASGDREILARKLKISKPQLKYVTNSNAGEGLLFFGNTIVPFIDKFPKDTILYQKMTTKPEEVR